MIWQFHGTDITVISHARDPHPRGFKTGKILGVHAIAAEMTRLDDLCRINRSQPGTREKPDRMKIMQNGGIARAVR
jgi:hypothetical protein